ncbi:DUF6332 family protein [Streptomyces subrutilus]|uniref:Uncharacterized protein n=1 Tax=Streptomyces subrutilus TaxID=36818 RepID=A0A5P2USL0_9ACTN|nr:DUF6332 family protein [Streptomyces subrutilus]QEU81860.1 hypothetical protein CP968_29445 [Streptomyces subrutilus]WSJ28699.1 DUF6332 family protein [Streptomyces subrutilus]GGZ94132.1 hypothetical protein GCM10010371_62450 [Streptomyces subrutilus]
MGRRTQADRDAITVEIGYAFVSACLAAGLSFVAVYGAAPAFSLPPAAHRALTVAGGIVAAAVFVLRIAHVLWRFARRPENDGL